MQILGPQSTIEAHILALHDGIPLATNVSKVKLEAMKALILLEVACVTVSVAWETLISTQQILDMQYVPKI